MRTPSLGALALAGTALALVLACGSTQQEVTGFFCGGLAGNSCPPATECKGSCGVPDCGNPCVATVKCQNGGANCPVAYTCDTATAYCVPAKTCSTGAQCAADQYCASQAWGLSMGICVPLSALRAPPPAGCPWPFVSRSGACGVPCGFGAVDAGGGACPQGMTCDESTRFCK
jgi:hypothetical protein